MSGFRSHFITVPPIHTLVLLVSNSVCPRLSHHMASSNDDAPLTPTVSQRRRCRRRPTAVVPSTLAVIMATLVASLLVRCGLATRCDQGGTGEDDDWRPPSTVEVVLQAQSVIYGHVRRTFPDRSFDFGHGTLVYTAEIDVFCTLKGHRLDRVVNVSKAGSFTRLSIKYPDDFNEAHCLRYNKQYRDGLCSSESSVKSWSIWVYTLSSRYCSCFYTTVDKFVFSALDYSLFFFIASAIKVKDVP